jgi:DNA-binding NtrC family response regulator
MLDPVCLLVTDRNPRVRQFLYRELLHDGYKAFIVCTVQELKQRLHDLPCAETVIILDPEWVRDQIEECLQSIRKLPYQVRVIIHAHSDSLPELPDWTRLVEKKAESIQELQQILRQQLLDDKRHEPGERSSSSKKDE